MKKAVLLYHLLYRLAPLFVCFLFFPHTVHSQEAAIIVRTSLGEATFKNSDKWETLKEGVRLNLNQTIKIGAGGIVTLTKDTDYFAIIKGPKIMPVSQVRFQKYPGYSKRFISGMNEIFTAPKSEKGTWGDRGREYGSLLPVNGEQVLGDKVNFLWAIKIFRRSTFEIRDALNPKPACIIANTNDTNIVIPDITKCPDLISFDRTGIYKWSVSRPGNMEKVIYSEFTFAGKSTIDTLLLDLKVLEDSVKKSEPEVYYILKAGCYEAYKMYSESYKVYNTALSLFPGSLLIMDSYQKFILRIVTINQNNEDQKK